jgi:hypothetical protein
LHLAVIRDSAKTKKRRIIASPSTPAGRAASPSTGVMPDVAIVDIA